MNKQTNQGETRTSGGKHSIHVRAALRGVALLSALLSALLAGCADPGPGLAPPTPFPTLPPTSTPTPLPPTPTPYVFRPAGQQVEETTPTEPEPRAIPVDGELRSVYPPFEVSFPTAVNGQVLAIRVLLGQRVQQGDLVAELDDAELQETIAEIQLELSDRREEKADAVAEAEEAYQRAQEEAEWALEQAQHNLQVAQMQSPTTAVAVAQAKVDEAAEVEAQAADNYKQALDRPWEPQATRDGLWKEWQARISARELAEMQLQDAKTALNVYYMDLEVKKRSAERAAAALERLQQRDTSSYDDAIAAVERRLAVAEERLQYTRLHAPHAGLVVSIDTFQGAHVSGGTPIVTLLNADELRFVTTNLNERHATLLYPGQPARVSLRAYPDVIFDGQVETVLPLSEPKGEIRFEAYIVLDPASVPEDAGELELWPAMTGRAEIPLDDQ